MKRVLPVLFVLIVPFVFLSGCYSSPIYTYEVDFVITGSNSIDRAEISCGTAYYYDEFADIISYPDVNIVPGVDYEFWAQTGEFLYLYARNITGSSNGVLKIEIFVDGYLVAESDTSSVDGVVELYYYLD